MLYGEIIFFVFIKLIQEMKHDQQSLMVNSFNLFSK
jgi:hypothetical protein